MASKKPTKTEAKAPAKKPKSSPAKASAGSALSAAPRRVRRTEVVTRYSTEVDPELAEPLRISMEEILIPSIEPPKPANMFRVSYNADEGAQVDFGYLWFRAGQDPRQAAQTHTRLLIPKGAARQFAEALLNLIDKVEGVDAERKAKHGR